MGVEAAFASVYHP
jgi:hypothetical protein